MYLGDASKRKAYPEQEMIRLRVGFAVAVTFSVRSQASERRRATSLVVAASPARPVMGAELKRPAEPTLDRRRGRVPFLYRVSEECSA